MSDPLTDTPDDPDEADDDKNVSRRDFARLGVFAGGLALTAPSIRTISFAGKIVGSVHTPPTTGPPVTEQGTTVSSSSTSSTTSSTEPGSTTTTTSATGAQGSDKSSGVLPYTGAAIGGLAVVGGAAVAVGRAMASADKRRGTEADQLLGEDDGA